MTAAAFAALGRLSLVGVILAASAGAIVGDDAGYWIGRKGGVALVRRYGARFGLDDEKLERARGFFERHGAKTVFIGRFVALLRSWAAAPAGSVLVSACVTGVEIAIRQRGIAPWEVGLAEVEAA